MSVVHGKLVPATRPVLGVQGLMPADGKMYERRSDEVGLPFFDWASRAVAWRD